MMTLDSSIIDLIQDKLDEIRKYLADDAKVSLVIRVPGDRDACFLVTNDYDLDGVRDAITCAEEWYDKEYGSHDELY